MKIDHMVKKIKLNFHKYSFLIIVFKVNQVRKSFKRHSDTNKIFLREWLSLNFETILTEKTLEMLSDKTGMTRHQVYDFLRNEKKKRKKIQSVFIY